jgi:hypothetical protein
MYFIKNAEYKNILIDIVITVLAFQLIDISYFVRESLPFTIYFIVFVQTFILFLLYGDFSFDDSEDEVVETGFLYKIRYAVGKFILAFALFNWLISLIWVSLPFHYLADVHGEKAKIAWMISLFIAIVGGIILFVRFFANEGSGESHEEALMRRYFQQPSEKRNWLKSLIYYIYGFLFYKNIGSKEFRNWMGYVLVFIFLVYTETLFELMVTEQIVSTWNFIVAIIFSYFPIRMLLVAKPPVSLLEIISAFTAFGIFIYMLFF